MTVRINDTISILFFFLLKFLLFFFYLKFDFSLLKILFEIWKKTLRGKATLPL